MTSLLRPIRRLAHPLLAAGAWVAAGALVAAGAPDLAMAAEPDHAHMHDEQSVPADAQIGTVDFQVSCADAVKADFDRALALLHHMMYEQARSRFQEVAAADPDCAMAYWGAATTRFQPLWNTRPSTEDLQRGSDEVVRATELEPATEREQRLLEATAAFYRQPDDARLSDRLDAWAEGMQAAYRAHPGAADTAALYALSRLTRAQAIEQAEQREPLLDEAETILRGVWERAPTHPGAIHYAIHATDADSRAENALDMVEVYADIAPDVPHALHMPSHIYVRLADWPAVIDWNERSAQAALQHPVDDALSHHYLHALDYLVYAHLQRGEDDEAAAKIQEALSREEPLQPTFISAFHVSAMPARHAVERRAWPEAAALEPRSPEYLPWDDAAWAEGITWYARGLGAVHGDDPAQAQHALQRLQALRARADAEGDAGIATYLEVDERILAGWIARADGRDQEAVQLMRLAADLEATVEKHPVTPGALLPPFEALGDLLMDLGRPNEALAAYSASDEIWPGRFNTLLGAARAARAAGATDRSREYYQRLLSIAGDTARPGIAEAERFVAAAAVGSRPAHLP